MKTVDENNRPIPNEATGEGVAGAVDATASVPCGIKWTVRDVLHAKSHVVLSVCFVVVAILSIICLVIGASASQLNVQVSDVVESSISLKADQVGEAIGVLVVIFLPVVAINYFVVALVLKIVYCIRDRHVPRTPENLEAHRIEIGGSWRWQFSMLFGAIDFVAMYAIFEGIRWAFRTYANFELPTAVITIVTIAMLVIAERRVRHISEGTAAYLKANGVAITQTLAGERDAELPEKLRNDLGRSSVALVLSLGVVGSVKWAARLVLGVEIRTRVKLYSGFLCSFIHGILTALTFGIASTVSYELGRVPDAFAKGKQDELKESLLKKASTRPKLFPEVLALLVSVVYVTIELLKGIASGFGM